MGNRQHEIKRIEEALERAFPSTSRTKTETSLANDVDAIIGCSKLTAADLRLIRRLIDSFKAIIDERSNSN
jgi:hypothetical protein